MFLFYFWSSYVQQLQLCHQMKIIGFSMQFWFQEQTEVWWYQIRAVQKWRGDRASVNCMLLTICTISWLQYSLALPWYKNLFLLNFFPKNTSLACHYSFYDKISDVLHSLVLPVQAFTARTHHAISMESKHPHFFHIPSVSIKFQLDSYLT